MCSGTALRFLPYDPKETRGLHAVHMIVHLLLVNLQSAGERVGVVWRPRQFLEDTPGQGRGESSDPRGAIEGLNLAGGGSLGGLLDDPSTDHGSGEAEPSDINLLIMVLRML
jgi:hypothetical protein